MKTKANKLSHGDDAKSIKNYIIGFGDLFKHSTNDVMAAWVKQASTATAPLCAQFCKSFTNVGVSFVFHGTLVKRNVGKGRLMIWP